MAWTSAKFRDGKFTTITTHQWLPNDTIYSIAQIDVSGGPVLLRVPDTAGRYYVLQFVDAWTNNFAYVGRRATGTAAVISPVGELAYKGRRHVVNGGRIGELAQKLYDTIVGIQYGTAPDPHGWTMLV